MTTRAEIQHMWNRISDAEDFQSIVKKSVQKPQLIYKHSPSCSVSFLTKRDLDSNAQQLSEKADMYLINVIQERALSNAIAQELAIRHESPQAILLKDGKVAWEGSHWQVNEEAISSKIE